MKPKLRVTQTRSTIGQTHGMQATIHGLGLKGPGVSDEKIFEAMLEHPVLVERPIVVTPRGTKLCRPVDLVQSLLA